MWIEELLLLVTTVLIILTTCVKKKIVRLIKQLIATKLFIKEMFKLESLIYTHICIYLHFGFVEDFYDRHPNDHPRFVPQTVNGSRWRSPTTTCAGSAWMRPSTASSWSAVTWSPAPSAARGWTSVPFAGSTSSGPCTSSNPNVSRQLLRLGPQPPHYQPRGSLLLIPQQTLRVNISTLLYSLFFCTLKYNTKKRFVLRFLLFSFTVSQRIPLLSLLVCFPSSTSVFFFPPQFLFFFSSKQRMCGTRPRTLLSKHNTSPSHLPVNCSWYSAKLSIPKSASVSNCRQRTNVWVAQRTRARTHTTQNALPPSYRRRGGGLRERGAK